MVCWQYIKNYCQKFRFGNWFCIAFQPSCTRLADWHRTLSDIETKEKTEEKVQTTSWVYRVIWFSVLTLVSGRVQTPRRFRILSVGVWTLRNIENLLSICSSSASRGKYPAIFVIWRYVMYDLLWLPVPLWKELFSGKSTSPFRTQNCKSNIATNLLQW